MIPECYQGQDFKSPDELSIGQIVIDTACDRRQEVKVIKRYKYSVRLEYVDVAGNIRQYGQSLHSLRHIN